jgi:broad specificity phosphatase PhoE
MDILLVRHAQTFSNLSGMYAGRSDGGIIPGQEAELNGALHVLRRVGARTIQSSPLRRALETATVLANGLDIPLRREDALLEQEFGCWTGLTANDIQARYALEWEAWRRAPQLVRVPGMESLKDVQKRSLVWLESLRDGSSPVVACTHESVIKALLCAFHPHGWRYYRESQVRNCSIHGLRRVGEGYITLGELT